MRSAVLTWSLVVLCAGCLFDDRFLRDRFEPAVFALTNTSGTSIEITSIYSVPEVESAFILDEMTVAAGATQTVRIPKRTYDTLVAGDFVVEGRCKENAPGDWKTSGARLPREGDRNSNEWKVAITLAGCPPTDGRRRRRRALRSQRREQRCTDEGGEDRPR